MKFVFYELEMKQRWKLKWLDFLSLVLIEFFVLNTEELIHYSEVSTLVKRCVAKEHTHFGVKRKTNCLGKKVHMGRVSTTVENPQGGVLLYKKEFFLSLVVICSFESFKVGNVVSWAYWAHQYICTVGSYASLYVSLYVWTWPKFKLDKMSLDEKSLYVTWPKHN